MQAQAERIEQSFLDFAERLLAGGGCLEFRPLDPSVGLVQSVGSVSLMNGFTIRLRKDG